MQMDKRLLSGSLALVLAALGLVSGAQRPEARESTSTGSAASSSEVALEQRVDEYLQGEMKMDSVPGLSIMIMRDGKVLLARGYGFAQLETRLPAKPETVFELGSMTKQFTATAVMMLVEQGRIKLDDPITKYLANVPELWGQITVRHLLTHTSGIEEWTKLSELNEWKKQFIPHATIVRVLASKPLTFRPGEKHVYCNSNYYLLGLIIEQASGQTYAQFMTEHIFSPLHMNATRISDARPATALAQGYDRGGGKVDYIKVFSDGGIVSSALDLAKWATAFDSEQLLTQESRKQMWTALTLNDGRRVGYGFGFLVNRDKETGNEIIEHGGFTFGFSNFLTRLPTEKLTVVILSNSNKGYARFYSRGVAALYAPWFKTFWAGDELEFRTTHPPK